MAVPKGKVSKARRDKRRSSHWKLETPNVTTCPKCGATLFKRKGQLLCLKEGCGYVKPAEKKE